MSGTPGNPIQLAPIVIDSSMFVDLPDGSYLSAGHSPDFDGVYLEHLDSKDNLLGTKTFTYEEYEKYRRENPDPKLPDMPRPKKRAPGTNGNGNTVGRVVGESGTSGKPASEANPEVEAETAAEGDTGSKILDGVQLGLDVVGLIPVVGEVADIGNGIISAFRGDFVGAGLSFASAIPFAGYAASGAKAVRKGTKLAAAATEGAAKTAKRAPKPKASGGGRGRRGGGKKGGKGKGKKKPDCGQIGVYKRKSEYDNDGTNWDHVPSGRSLEQAAENKLKAMKLPDGSSVWGSLSEGQIRSVLSAARNEAYTVNIPEDVHKKSSPTWGSRNKPRYKVDAGKLRDAMLRDLDAIEKAMKDADHPCRKQYSKARRALQRIDPEKHLDNVIKKTLKDIF